MKGRGFFIAALAAIAPIPDAAAATDPASSARASIKMSVTGTKPLVRGRVCGRSRTASVADPGDRVRVKARASRARRAGRAPVLVVRTRRCARGERPNRLGSASLRSGRGRVRAKFPAAEPGGYRVIAEIRRSRRGRAIARSEGFLRVRSRTVSVPIRFDVTNVNRSQLSCTSDGAPYTVSGRLVTPRSALAAQAPAVTVYLHEFGWGRFFWEFPDSGLDYARHLAREGHASVVLDRLGYGESGRPPGTGTCLGSQADILNQIQEQLRSGGYSLAGTAPVKFGRVAAGGHSGGGAIAELAAYSFGTLDGIVLFAYADNGFTNRSVQEANEQGVACVSGGGDYQFFAQTEEEWKSFMFTSAAPEVQDRAAAMRAPDPCGDTGSFTPAVVRNNMGVPEIKAPVLLLYGTKDAIYDQPAAGDGQRDLFSGSDDVTLRYFEDTGHALTLERTAPEVRRVVSDWLAARGF